MTPTPTPPPAPASPAPAASGTARWQYQAEDGNWVDCSPLLRWSLAESGVPTRRLATPAPPARVPDRQGAPEVAVAAGEE